MDRCRLIVTPGEPAGIGAELLIKAVQEEQNQIITIDDPDRLAKLAADGGYPLDLTVIDNFSDIATTGQSHHLAVIPITWADTITAGTPSPAHAPQVIDAISMAVFMVKSGQADAIVTNPIQKATLHQAGFEYPGHTEFLAALDNPKDNPKAVPIMMLVNSMLRVVPLTIHMPLRDIFEHITSDHIMRSVRIMARHLASDFGISAPRIAVAGLNPHAGENGMLGKEDAMIIAPAIAQLQSEGLAVTGPHSADTLFFEDKRDSYDAVLAMYHDQALIPVKTLDFHHGVNTTLGLSFIRTSPDHGTALDQAGQFTARPDSLIAAIQLARDMSYNRAEYQATPLNVSSPNVSSPNVSPPNDSSPNATLR